jgi:aspartate carbamoyltransferase catalytic subunit
MLYLRLIILSVGCDVHIDSETFLVTDFVNLKNKPAQSFKSAYSDRVCADIFIEVSTRTCISIYIYTIFLKKKVLTGRWKKGRRGVKSEEKGP